VIAVDTNVIVRYLTADDPQQFTQARALIESENVYVCTTVLLETEWVLRRAYRLGRAQTIAALTAFAGLPHISLEDAASAAKALDWARRAWISPTPSISQRPRAATPSSASTGGSQPLPTP
jgi:predicted nucleic acid-binding protein